MIRSYEKSLGDKMTINTTKLPTNARLFIKQNDNIIFDGLVHEHNDETIYNSGALVRSRLYGMSPIEYGGSKDNFKQLVVDGVFTPIGYRDLIIPDICPDLPINERALKIMNEAKQAEADRKKAMEKEL